MTQGPSDVPNIPDNASGAFDPPDRTAPIISGDALWFRWNASGFRIEVGYDESPTGLGRTAGAVHVSPATAKILVRALGEHVDAWERMFGEIPLAPRDNSA
ncbi:MAG: hypothetical protein ACYC90_00365 [Candidatus Nanopelagicales bacterium]